MGPHHLPEWRTLVLQATKLQLGGVLMEQQLSMCPAAPLYVYGTETTKHST